MDYQLIQRAAKDILHSKKTIALTGAGISIGLVAPQVKSFLQLLKK